MMKPSKMAALLCGKKRWKKARLFPNNCPSCGRTKGRVKDDERRKQESSNRAEVGKRRDRSSETEPGERRNFVAILFDPKLTVTVKKEIKSDDGRIIILETKIDDEISVWVNIYAPNNIHVTVLLARSRSEHIEMFGDLPLKYQLHKTTTMTKTPGM